MRVQPFSLCTRGRPVALHRACPTSLSGTRHDHMADEWQWTRGHRRDAGPAWRTVAQCRPTAAVHGRRLRARRDGIRGAPPDAAPGNPRRGSPRRPRFAGGRHAHARRTARRLASAGLRGVPASRRRVARLPNGGTRRDPARSVGRRPPASQLAARPLSSRRRTHPGGVGIRHHARRAPARSAPAPVGGPHRDRERPVRLVYR